jgi:hypothetical protein
MLEGCPAIKLVSKCVVQGHGKGSLAEATKPNNGEEFRLIIGTLFHHLQEPWLELHLGALDAHRRHSADELRMRRWTVNGAIFSLRSYLVPCSQLRTFQGKTFWTIKLIGP